MSKLQNRPRSTKEDKKTINFDFKNFKLDKGVLIRTVGVLFVGLLLVWFFNQRGSDYDKLIARYRIDNLVQDQYYDQSIHLLDNFILDAQYQGIKNELEQKRNNIILLKEEASYSLPMDSLFLSTEALLVNFRPAEGLERLELALEKGKYEDEQRAKIEEKIMYYKEFENNLENEGIIKMLKDYRVKTGETLNGIAYKHGMQPAELQIINKLKSQALREGQFIKVKADVKIIKHIVQSGEFLSSIAVKYGMSTSELKKINRKEDNSLQSGEILKVMQKMEIKIDK